MGNEYRSGQKLKYVVGPDSQDGSHIYYLVGYSECTAIEVVMENGQMSGVPWALVYINNKPNRKVNLALMEEVGLLEESEVENDNGSSKTDQA